MDYSLTSAAVENATRSENYEAFRVMLEGDFSSFRPHNGGHVAVGGEMSNFYSSPGGELYFVRYSTIKCSFIVGRATLLAASCKPRSHLVAMAESICFSSVRDIGSDHEGRPPCRVNAGLHPQNGEHGPQCHRRRCYGSPCRAQLLYLRLRYPALLCLPSIICGFHVFLRLWMLSCLRRSSHDLMDAILCMSILD